MLAGQVNAYMEIACLAGYRHNHHFGRPFLSSPTPLHLPAKKNQKRYREAMHACEPSISPANQLRRWKRLVHLPDEGVDVLLTVTKVTTLDVVLELASAEATSGVGELEGPEEVGGLLEVGADGVDLVDEILHTDHAVLSEVLLDDLVVSQRQALLVNLAISALCVVG